MGASGDLWVVRDQDDGGAAPVEVVQQPEDDFARRRVQASRRLVGEDQPGPVGQRSRHRHLLLLAARETIDPRARAIPEADEVEQMPRPLRALLHLDAGEGERQGDVLLRRHRRDEVERLEDCAHALQPVVGEVRVGQLVDRQPRGVDVAGGGLVQPAHEREQRCLAASGRAHDRHELAGTDLQGDVLQRGDVHLVAVAKLARYRIDAQPDRLAQEVGEFLRRCSFGDRVENRRRQRRLMAVDLRRGRRGGLGGGHGCDGRGEGAEVVADRANRL